MSLQAIHNTLKSLINNQSSLINNQSSLINNQSSDIYLNFNINCTPDATIRLLMDSHTNDYITMQGNGMLRAIKAVVNELHDRGLRILEVRKEQLHAIPAILDELNTNPLKFILFIDDLTFASDDRDFCALKAILEGGISSRSKNVLIYATSNQSN